MGFNRRNFLIRTVTAIIFAAVMLAGLLWNQWSFLILFSIIHFGCWWEYLNLVEKIHKIKIEIEFKVLSMLSGYFLFWILCAKRFQIDFSIQIAEMQVSLKWIFLIFILFFLLIYLLANRKIKARVKWMILSGFVYISLSLALMVNLYSEMDVHVHDTKYVFGRSHLPLAIVISIWINDTMAYLVGSMIGRTPLSKISPKKTWEGTLGGIILSIVLVGLISYYGLKVEWLAIPLMIVAALAAIAGTFGDLLESKLKRLAGVKDSGKLMPGHGGFLDRFDSMLLAIPAVWLYVYFFLN